MQVQVAVVIVGAIPTIQAWVRILNETRGCVNIVAVVRSASYIPVLTSSTALDIAAALAKLVQGDDDLLLKDRPTRKSRESASRAARIKPDSGSRRQTGKRSDDGMESYRIEVGHKQGVQPGNIVGAIANESGIDPMDIGRIDIQDNHSIVDMRNGIPRIAPVGLRTLPTFRNPHSVDSAFRVAHSKWRNDKWHAFLS